MVDHPEKENEQAQGAGRSSFLLAAQAHFVGSGKHDSGLNLDMNRSTSTPVTTDKTSPFDSASQISSSETSVNSGEALPEPADTITDTKPAAGAAPEDTSRGETERGKHAITRTRDESIILAQDSYDSDSLDSDSLDDPPTIKQASYMEASDLYESFLNKLARDAASTEHSASDTRNPKASNLVTSFIDYIRVLEGRVGQLESKLTAQGGKSAEGKEHEEVSSQEKEQEETPGEEKQHQDKTELWGDIAKEIKFFGVEKELTPEGRFSALEGAYIYGTDDQQLIRVLYNWNEDAAQKRPPNPSVESPNLEDIDIIGIKVTSEPIVRFLEKHIGLIQNGVSTVRFSKPFRPLVQNIQQLRGQYDKLKEKFGKINPSESAQPNTQAGNGGEPMTPLSANPPDDEKTEEYDRREAYDHFRILVEFLESHLERAFRFLDKFNATEERVVMFPDLWMLFNAGDTIYSPFLEGGQRLVNDVKEVHITKRRDAPQAYRVVAVIGGVPIRPKKAVPNARNMAVRDEDRVDRRMKNKYTPLYVYCFCIDFNGIKYGTVPEIFVFKPFDGLVDIRSLSAYPLQYMIVPSAGKGTPDMASTPEQEVQKDNGDIQNNLGHSLIKRGEDFLGVTAASHRYMGYEGLTVGESREEINSPVIIDFKLGFQAYRQFPDPDAVVPIFSSITKLWDNLLFFHAAEFTRDSSPRSMRPFVDEYHTRQKDQRQDIEAKVKLALDEYESNMIDKKGGIEEFTEYLRAEDLVILLPGVVPAFALRNRRWIQVDLNLLRQIKQEDGWKRLMLPKGHKRMVRAMVETHARGPTSQPKKSQGKIEMDLVKEKGKGCIILLHGAPGVGKTSTAECVAEYTKRPLYAITSGDVGYVPENVEANMEKHFKLAHKWGCVLLLDEADVFLAKRTKEDIKRNGLVSVFLRILEYYPGILFLTTNRVGAIDDAFRSRLHLTLYYPKLDEEQTKKIWEMNLKEMKRINAEREKNSRPPIEFDKKKILKWVSKHWAHLGWNGRQIRNAFQTAVALGEFKEKIEVETAEIRMEVKDFRTIARASQQFNTYLAQTHGMDEAKTAERDRIRMDNARHVPIIKDALTDYESDEDSDDSDEESGGSESEGQESGEEDNESGESDGSEDSEEEKKKRRRRKSVSKSKKSSESKSKGKEEKGKSKRKDKSKEKSKK